MSKDFSDSLFDYLEDMGLNSLTDIPLYSEEKEEKIEKAATKITSPADFVYEKKVECPVCYKQISIRQVKTSGVRVISRDSDFMTYYQEPNPMYYDVWVCVSCGYAAPSSKFGNLTEKQKKLIKDNISSKWKPNKQYPPLYTVDIAIEMHQLALLNSVIKHSRDSEKAMLCLKIAWFYRLKKDTQNENKFLLQAQQGFIKALEKELTPIFGLDESGIEYLIGEIYRRLGDNSSALLWLGRVLVNRNTKSKIKDMARDQKDFIYQQQSNGQNS